MIWIGLENMFYYTYILQFFKFQVLFEFRFYLNTIERVIIQQYRYNMHFSSISVLIQAHVEALIRNNKIKDASLFLTIPSTTPFLAEDSNRINLRVTDAEVTAHPQNYQKIQQGANIRLDNVSVYIDFVKGGFQINSVQVTSKKVIIDVGEKEKQIKNFEFKAELIKNEGTLPFTILTQRYLRRLDKQQQTKKYYKQQTKTDVLSFSNYTKKNKKVQLQSSSELNNLDSQSVGILSHLVSYVDKEQIFHLLIKKNLKDRQSKKAVRLAIVPTDVESDNQRAITKRKFNRNTILQLLAEYEARQEMFRE